MSVLIPTRILVPTDFSQPALNALRYACGLAERFGSSIVLLYADTFFPPVDFTSIPGGEFDFARTRLIEDERDRLEAYAKVHINPPLRYETRVEVNEPVTAITQASESNVELVIMGTHGRTGLKRMLFGSVTAAVMRLARVPVIAVDGTAVNTARAQRVLCPVSLSAACREALRFATLLSDGPLVLLQTVRNRKLQQTVNESIALQNWIPPELEQRCEMKSVLLDTSAEDIVSMARLNDVGLIVLDAPTDRRMLDVIRGTLAEKLVQLSFCPVLTVNARAAEANAFKDIARELLLA